MGAPRDIHGACVAVGEAGVLLRGPSGSGKSALALALIETARVRGLFARLVADDRVVLWAVHGRLVARPHPGLAGLVEERGVGIVPVPHLPAVVVRLVVDLAFAPERLPERSEVVLEGVALPHCAVAAGRAPAAETVLRRLGAAGVVAASPGS